MDLLNEFNQLCRDFPEFRQLVAKAEATTTDEGMRRELQSIGSKMDENFAQFQKTFPKAMDDLKKRNAQTEQTIQRTQQMVNDAQTQAAAAQAALITPALAVPAVDGIAVDPRLGPLLRGELLERFGIPSPPSSQGKDSTYREIWEDWDEWK